MRYFPIFLELQDRPCLVIGQGRLAEEKAAQLERAGGRVLRRPFFNPAEELPVFLIFAVVENLVEGKKIRDYAEKNRILVNVVDQTANCNFIAPALLERGDLSIAVSTSGRCPALASHIRRQLEKEYGAEYSGFLEFLAVRRESVREKLRSFEERREFYRRLFEKGLLDTWRTEGPQKASELFSSALKQF
jgi:precorrin-2 dehydrogenase/sirohydrochlorin ferrochelatase